MHGPFIDCAAPQIHCGYHEKSKERQINLHAVLSSAIDAMKRVHGIVYDLCHGRMNLG